MLAEFLDNLGSRDGAPSALGGGAGGSKEVADLWPMCTHRGPVPEPRSKPHVPLPSWIHRRPL